MDNLDLAAIRARCDAATPGPWKIIDKGNSVRSFAVVSETVDGRSQQMICPNMSPLTFNAAFIASARTDIPALLSEVERLTAERDAAVEAHRYYGCDSCKYEFVEPYEHPCRGCKEQSNWQWRGPQKPLSCTFDE